MVSIDMTKVCFCRNIKPIDYKRAINFYNVKENRYSNTQYCQHLKITYKRLLRHCLKYRYHPDVFDVLLVLLTGDFAWQDRNFRHPDIASTPEAGNQKKSLTSLGDQKAYYIQVFQRFY